jgi:hypothetical protein
VIGNHRNLSSQNSERIVMARGRRPPGATPRSLSFSIMVDYCGLPLDESSVLDFLHSEVESDSPPSPEIVADPSPDRLLRVTYSSKSDMDAVVKLNGRQFAGTPLFICRYDPSTYDPLLPQLRAYFESHFDGTTVDLSNLRANSLPLNLGYFRDFEFCLCLLGATLRRSRRSAHVLNLAHNNIRNLNALDQVKVFLPALHTVRIAGNPVDASAVQRLQQTARVEVVTEEPDSEIGSPPPPAPRGAIEVAGGDPRTECLLPLVEFLVRASASDVSATGGCYASDACFSVLCGKLGSEWKQLFPGNRNLVHPGSHAIAQVSGAAAIGARLKELFPTGLKLTDVVVHAAVVSVVFYAINLYGTATADGKSLVMMRAMAVVGRAGRLQIANDVLSLRYPDRGRR